MKIASHIQACEFFDPEQPVLGHMHQFVEDKLRRQRLMKNHNIVEGYGAHGSKVGQVNEAQLLEIGVKGGITDALFVRLAVCERVSDRLPRNTSTRYRQMPAVFPARNTYRAGHECTRRQGE